MLCLIGDSSKLNRVHNIIVFNAMIYVLVMGRARRFCASNYIGSI